MALSFFARFTHDIMNTYNFKEVIIMCKKIIALVILISTLLVVLCLACGVHVFTTKRVTTYSSAYSNTTPHTSVTVTDDVTNEVIK